MRFDKNFFEKHQTLLLKITNSPWLSWLLGLNRLPEGLRGKKICKISPNSIHWSKGRNKKGVPTFQAAFFTAPRFAEALAFNLSPFVYFNSLRVPKFQFSPVGVFGMIVAALVPKIGFLGFIGTTTTFYAGSGNGWVYVATGTVWATERARGTGDGASVNPSSTDNYFQCYKAGSTYIIGHNFYPADTSALTSGVIVDSASLNYYYSPTTNVNGVGNVVVATSQASTSTLATTDFGSVGSTDFGRKLWSAHSSNAMNLIDLNASGLAAISLTGVTKIGIRNTRDFDDSAPTGNNYAGTRFAAYTGTTSDPYYSITYSLAATIVTPSALTLTAALQAPTVIRSDTESPSTLALALTLNTPSLKTDDSFAPSAQALTLTLQTPDILAGKIATPDALTLTSAVLAPSLGLGRGVSVSAVSLTSAVQSVTFVLGRTVLPSALALTLTLETIAGRWNNRVKPTSIWTDRTPPTTNWS